MSLNWREIARILSELPLEGSHIQRLRQPDFKSLVFELYRPGGPWTLYINLSAEGSRLHSLSRKAPRGAKPQRFVQFLRARVRGGKITGAQQLPGDRIILLSVLRGGEKTQIWLRLWGAASNIIVTDGEDRILDAYFRRPKRGEETGGHYAPEAPAPGRDDEDRYPLRPHPVDTSFNSFIEEEYRKKEEEDRRQRLLALLENRFKTRELRLRSRLSGLENRKKEYTDPERFRTYGDLITANLYRIRPGETWLEAENYDGAGGEIQIKLDPAISPQKNAESYYRRYKKARSGLEILDEEIRNLEKELRRIRDRRRELLREEDLEKLEEAAGEEIPPKGQTRDRDAPPGLQYQSGGFQILVGRTGAENDDLLRRHVRGNDFWLHTRDHPGGYVFIRNKPGKSVPLDTLLDAGNLAVFYSKARSSGAAELYYTRVKYLRRAKGAPRGTVLPSQEKNLSITLDPARLERLRGKN